jgi:hypothetical protein
MEDLSIMGISNNPAVVLLRQLTDNIIIRSSNKVLA